ncbi:nucleotidyltransferase family protein, partial [Patescibacteria group bacterium]|nr:nucleotidyltransferase family protein [Patescibacteria group bacterium]
MLNKAVILAGGKGTRMGHLTADLPKQLIPVNGRPFAFYLLNNLAQAGFTDIIIVIGYKKEKWADFLKTLEWNVRIVDQNERVSDKYGTACPVEATEPEVGQDNFIAVNGDNLYSPSDLEAMRHQDDLNYVTCFRSEHPELYGVLEADDNGLLKKIHERSPSPPTNMTNAGLYKFTPKIFEAIKNIGLSPRGEYEITDAISWLAQQHL